MNLKFFVQQDAGRGATDNIAHGPGDRHGSTCADRRRGHRSRERRAQLQEQPPDGQAAGDLRQIATDHSGIFYTS